MRKKLLCLFVVLIYAGIVTGFSETNPESEEPESIQYEYDELNRVIKAEYPDGTTITYCYDKNGNLLETIVEQPEEATADTEEAAATEDVGSDIEIPGREIINQEYAFTNGNENYGITGNNLGEEGFLSQDRKIDSDTIDGGVNGGSDSLLDYKNQGMWEEKETESIEEEKSYLGWILAVVLAIILTAGILWRNKRRKQDED